MTALLTPLVLHPLPRRKWLVVESFRVYADEALTGVLEVPAGFITDLNSVPRFWWAVSPATDWPEAAVVHDWMYARQRPRDEADRVYRELLIHLGMGLKRAEVRYRVLRLLGWYAYHQHVA